MEGRWGTRISGFVKRDAQATRFCLVWEQDSERIVKLDRLVNNAELDWSEENKEEGYPTLYQRILTSLTSELEHHIQVFAIVPPQ